MESSAGLSVSYVYVVSALISGVKNLESQRMSLVRGLPFSHVQSQSEKGSIFAFLAGVAAAVVCESCDVDIDIVAIVGRGCTAGTEAATADAGVALGAEYDADSAAGAAPGVETGAEAAA